MKKNIAVCALLAVALLAGSASVRAVDAPPPAVYTSKLPTMQFHGRITAVNPTARTITLGNRVIRVSPLTHIDDRGNAVGLKDLVPGEFINLAYKADNNGRLHALVMHVRSFPKHSRAISR